MLILSLLHGWTVLIQPLLLEDGVQIFIAPLSLKPNVLEKMTFAAHPKTLKQGYRGCILTIGNCDDTMEMKRHKGVGEQTRDGLCCKPLPLTRTREGISNFSLPLVVFIDGEVTVSNKHPRFLGFDGNLHPLAGYASLGLLLLLNKSIC